MQFTPHCSHWAGGEICLCALEGALPRATQTTQGSTTSLRLSWDEIPNVSQLLWLPPCWGHTGPLAGPSDSPAVCAQGHRKAGFPVGLLLTPPCSFIFYVTPSHPASLLMSRVSLRPLSTVGRVDGRPESRPPCRFMPFSSSLSPIQSIQPPRTPHHGK